MSAPTPKDLIKRKALNKLEECLKECFSNEVATCPLKSFEFKPFLERFSEEELHEIYRIIERLHCTWELKQECDSIGISITCPYKGKECDFKCGID